MSSIMPGWRLPLRSEKSTCAHPCSNRASLEHRPFSTVRGYIYGAQSSGFGELVAATTTDKLVESNLRAPGSKPGITTNSDDPGSPGHVSIFQPAYGDELSSHFQAALDSFNLVFSRRRSFYPIEYATELIEMPRDRIEGSTRQKSRQRLFGEIALCRLWYYPQ
jgi:hypothetical protein